LNSLADVFIKLKEELNLKYGEGNWKIRKVSRVKKNTDVPSLTITEELKKIGLEPGDYVVVVTKDNSICIEKI